MTYRGWLPMAILSLIWVVEARPQTISGARPQFEVASVKLNTSGELGARSGTRAGGRYIATNQPLKTLLAQAYGIQDFQLTGGPGWIASDRFDVNAKAESEVPEKEIMRLLQSLLEERFQLKWHRETKEMGIYELVVAKSGPKGRESSGDGTEMNFGLGGRVLTMKNASMTELATMLAIQLRTTVVDRTDLKAKYDIELSWRPDPGASNPDLAPAIFTTIQEQLGLRLDSTKGPVDVLVVDSAQKLQN